MNRYQRTQVALLAYEWCVNNWGTPTKTLPKIYLSDDKRFKTKYGDYQNKLITVYLNTCNTKKRIIETVLHEYCHFLQMPKNSDMVKYQYYSLFYDYHYHPLELEAVDTEKTNYRECSEWVSKKISK